MASRRAALTLALTLAAAPAAATGIAPPKEPAPPADASAASVRRWSTIACDAVGLDHAPPVPGEPRLAYGEQAGPHRSSRALAMAHVAIFEAVNAVDRRYRSYLGLPRAERPASASAATARAAHDVLVSLFPAQASRLGARLAEDLAELPQGALREAGLALGARIAAKLVALRANDGSAHEEPVVGVDYPRHRYPGLWRPDPISGIDVALGARWGKVRPFAMTSSRQFRVRPAPPITGLRYAAAFLEVKRFGGDGTSTPTERSEDQTKAGLFWAYDGTPHLGTPPRLYNLLALRIAEVMGTDEPLALARLLALVNVAVADAALAAWESKYAYEVWRPVTGLREGDRGSGPLGKGDLNPLTDGDPGFVPLGASATYLSGPSFTPPFPAYPSGHATMGSALFQTLRRFYGTDRIAFTFVSEELDGEAPDGHGGRRPWAPRSFSTLSEAEEENGQSRIWLGIHWEFDKTAGMSQGRRVADWVIGRLFKPLR